MVVTSVSTLIAGIDSGIWLAGWCPLPQSHFTIYETGMVFPNFRWLIKIRIKISTSLADDLHAILHIRRSDAMLSVYFRTYDVRVAQPLNRSSDILQLQGLPRSYPESSGPGKQGIWCFLLTPLLSWVTCVQLIWSLSLPDQTLPSEDPQAPRPCGCAQWSSLSCSRNVYGDPPSLAKKFA